MLFLAAEEAAGRFLLPETKTHHHATIPTPHAAEREREGEFASEMPEAEAAAVVTGGGSRAAGPADYERFIILFSPEGRLCQLGECPPPRHAPSTPTKFAAGVCALANDLLLQFRRPPPRAAVLCALADYAFNAVKLAGITSVGLRGDDSVYVLTHRKEVSTSRERNPLVPSFVIHSAAV